MTTEEQSQRASAALPTWYLTSAIIFSLFFLFNVLLNTGILPLDTSPLRQSTPYMLMFIISGLWPWINVGMLIVLISKKAERRDLLLPVIYIVATILEVMVFVIPVSGELSIIVYAISIVFAVKYRRELRNRRML